MTKIGSNKIQLSIFLCLCMCLGIGILRFSYTALLPSTRLAYHWDSSFASILSSANLLGYLIGAFWAMKLPQNFTMPRYIILGGIFWNGEFTQLCFFRSSRKLVCLLASHFRHQWWLIDDPSSQYRCTLQQS